jgi:nucleoside-diphosphate-sugar epimerase
MKYSPEVSAIAKGASNVDRARKELGYRPHYGLFGGLKQYTEFLKKG